ncbi:unnamed protein product, partial [Symbiodinium sp. KB8]
AFDPSADRNILALETKSTGGLARGGVNVAPPSLWLTIAAKHANAAYRALWSGEDANEDDTALLVGLPRSVLEEAMTHGRSLYRSSVLDRAKAIAAAADTPGAVNRWHYELRVSAIDGVAYVALPSNPAVKVVKSEGLNVEMQWEPA